MLSDCWLLSDLDGTLISTPHKAQGKYPPITQSPCFHPIRRWLMNGGNVCIITTADLRTLDQIYFPLQPHLPQGRFGDCQQDTEKGGNGNPTMLKRSISHPSDTSDSSSDPHQSTKDLLPLSNQNNEKSESFCQGTLLLSLYSGAALYRCTPNSVELVKDYVNSTHYAINDSADLLKSCETPEGPMRCENKGESGGGNGPSNAANYVQGTCITRCVSETLLVHLTKIYESYIYDLLRGEPVVVAASQRLSHRYQLMWKMIFRYLDDLYQCVCETRCVEKPVFASDNDFTESLSTVPKDEEAVLWKMRYLHSRPDLLISLGVLRVECLVDSTFSNLACGPLDPCQSEPTKDQSSLIHAITSLLLQDLPQDAAEVLEPRARAFASHMVHALGVDPGCLGKRRAKSDAARVDVAQVILLGVPLGLYSRYFVKSIPEFVRIGVHIMPQPNSVVFSKLGINKSTVVQYLLGYHSNPNRSPRWKAGVRGLSLPRSPCGMPPVSTVRVIALGDNPHTTDYGLTVFRKVRFISVEKIAQREERHQRIERRLSRTRMLEELGERPCMPDGSPAPSFKELVASLTRCGPLMDDRLFKNIAYVGNEEDGTALFLTSLMDELKVPSFSASTNFYRKSSARFVDSETFTAALSKAVSFASCEGRLGKVKSNL
ncbi:unnamed protein product [Phytomonas sp. Hart1]|nr:unnamed protein product [Phytomonas sp. Hart1]|eukprot:CCW71451.1 unnamed protein product [Phytomonas sp. isolate Hart1]